MKPKQIRDAILALLALVVALTATYWLDYAEYLLIERARQNFDYSYVSWMPALGQLALATGLVALVWWLATGATYPRIIDVIYVLAGLAAVLFIPAVFAFHLTISSYALIDSGPISLWTVAGATFAMAGIFHLLRRRPAA